jgi:hypothetical protein
MKAQEARKKVIEALCVIADAIEACKGHKRGKSCKWCQLREQAQRFLDEAK